MLSLVGEASFEGNGNVRGPRGTFQYMTYRVRAIFLGVEFPAGQRFLGPNLSEIQIFGVKLIGADPRFLGLFWLKKQTI